MGVEKLKDSQLTYMSVGSSNEIMSPINFIPNENKNINGLCQWENDQESFFPAIKLNLFQKIPAGYYKIFFDQQRSSWGVKKKEIIHDEIVDLSSKTISKIINDIKLFWDKKSHYEKYKFLHKRGIIMYGPQGTGKTTIINKMVETLVIEHNGLVFSIEDSTDLNSYVAFSSILRQIEPDRPLIVVIEDIDGLLDDGRTTEKVLLNVLNGINQIQRVVYIATTNYPEKIGPRLMNRPGRFDRRFKIGQPSQKMRKAFFESKLLDEDKNKFDIDLIVEKTKDLSIAHCKEVFAEYIIKGRDLDEIIQEMKQMSEALHSNQLSTSKKVGFGMFNQDEENSDD